MPRHTQAGGCAAIRFRCRKRRRLHRLIKLRCRCRHWGANWLRMMEFTSYTKFALPRFQIIGAIYLTLLKQQVCINFSTLTISWLTDIRFVCMHVGMRRREDKPVVMGIHKYLVELGSRIQLHVLDGEICKMHQICMSQFSNNTAHWVMNIINTEGTKPLHIIQARLWQL